MASFSKLKMRTALIMIALIPLLGLLYFSISLTLEKSAVAREMGQLEMLVDLSVKIGNLVHELQKERGMTAGFLGSKGVKFAGELPAQRNEADKKIGALKQATAAFETDQSDHSIKDLLDTALREIDELGTTRNAVSAQSITSEGATDYYSRTIGKLLDITNQASTLSSNSRISRLGSSYAVLLMDKEYAGQERAALTGVFTADKFTPATLSHYFSDRVSQDVHKSIFDTYALDEHKQFYKNKVSGQAVDEVAAIEKTAIEKMNEKNLGIDSANWFKVITEKINLLKEVEDKLANDLLESTMQLKAKAESMMTFYILLSAGVLAITLAFAMYMIRRLLRQIGGEPDYAAYVLRLVAEGDLTVQVQVHSGDTTSLLASLKGMVNRLSELVGDVRSSSDTINVASREIAQGNADLSQRTEEQASSLEETASSMEELTSTVKQNAENARQANQLATNASDIAVKGGQVVGEVVQTMSSISDSSKKIVDIISVIDSIAFQTNILALNAAVEAARAGEQGRGFAVVAGEVRNLAQRSAAAAKEIKALIGDSVDKVMVGSRQVEQAGATMGEIVTAVRRVTDIMSEIAAASNEQSAGIEQINQAITQMDEVTQQNAALVEEAAAAAESLDEEAQRQAQSVSVFKLNESATQPQAAGRAPAARPAGPPASRVAVTHNPIIIRHELAAKHAQEPLAMLKQANRTGRPDIRPNPLSTHKGNGEADWAEF